MAGTLNDTPGSNRLHIGVFGKTNSGKSSFINAFTHQEVSIVADIAGTTTDPVYKPMEISPLGPCVIIDTAGFDDTSELGERRVEKTKLAAEKADIAVIVVSQPDNEWDITEELKWYQFLKEKNTPVLFLVGKSDIDPHTEELISYIKEKTGKKALAISAETGAGIDAVREELARLVPENFGERKITGELVTEEDLVLLVMPQDIQAPKGRLILPQVQAIRDVLDGDACCVVVKETQLAGLLSSLGRKPDMVVTDSQAFAVVSKIVSEDIPLTSSSILMARCKGFLETAVRGASALRHLRDGDKVLISEGCTHHRQCGDIGAVKLPRWLRAYSGADILVELSSGTGFPEDLSEFSLVLHCGGCMLSEREMLYRMKCAQEWR